MKKIRLSVYRHLPGIIFCVLILCTLRVEAAGQERELLIGLEPEHNIFDQVERYRALTEYLAKTHDIRIRLTIMSRYGEVLKRFQSLRLDGAFLNSYTAALAIKEFELEPLARPVNPDGTAISQAYVFVRNDSGIKTVADMKGRSFVFVDPATTEGYLFPMAYLQRNGVHDKDEFFNRYYFSGSHASTVSAVLDGRADIGSAKGSIFNRQVAADPSISSELTILARSPDLPETTFCIRNDIPDDLKKKLKTALLRMNTTKEGMEVLKKMGVLLFIGADASDFDIISDLTRDAGIIMGRGQAR